MVLLFTGSTIEYPYSDHTEFPWNRIEAECGLQFDDIQRADIFEVWTWLQHERAFFRQSYPLNEIEELRSDLLETCRNLDKLVAGARRRDNPLARSRLNVLAAYLGGDAQKALEKAARAARTAGFALKEPRGRTAHAVDARSEDALVLRRALAFMRSQVGEEKKMRASLWGLSPSPRSAPFRRFLASLLGYDKITEDTLRNRLRELGAEASRKPCRK